MADDASCSSSVHGGTEEEEAEPGREGERERERESGGMDEDVQDAEDSRKREMHRLSRRRH